MLSEWRVCRYTKLCPSSKHLVQVWTKDVVSGTCADRDVHSRLRINTELEVLPEVARLLTGYFPARTTSFGEELRRAGLLTP